jgi:hypothetical protein
LTPLARLPQRRRPADYPINDDGSPIRIVNFNGVGGSTIMHMEHSSTSRRNPWRNRWT